MNLINVLQTQKDFEETQLEMFNKWWYDEGKDLVIKELQKQIYIPDDKSFIMRFGPSRIILSNNKIFTPFLYKFLRSKLWNMGLNLLFDLNINTYIKIKENEKYSECFMFNNCKVSNPSESCYILSIISGISPEQVKQIFETKKYPETDKKKKQNYKQKRKENKLDNGHNIKDFENVSNNTTSMSGNQIVTLHNVSYDKSTGGKVEDANTYTDVN